MGNLQDAYPYKVRGLMNGRGVLSVLSHAVRQRYDRSWTRAPQMPLPVQVSGLKWLGCHVGTEVSRCCTRGESKKSIVQR